jgi:hypothetical protein
MGKRDQKIAEPQHECNSCGWFGVTDRMLGTIGPLCPECGDTTELSAAMDELQLKFEGLLKDNTAMPCHARRQLAVVMVTFAQVHFAKQPAPVTPPPAYGPVEIVSDLVRNLLTLDQSTPVFAAFHIDYQGKRACRTRPVSISLERVVDGKWVDTARKDVPYSCIVWAKPKADDKAQLATAEPAPELHAPVARMAECQRFLTQLSENPGQLAPASTPDNLERARTDLRAALNECALPKE